MRDRQLVLLLLVLGAAYLLVPFPEDASDLYGISLGVAGTVLMVAMHGYTLRKRRTVEAGSVRNWLSLHMAFGLVGPFLVLKHTDLVFVGVAGFVFFVMAAEVLSALTGRYIYTRIPRTKHGFARDLKDVEAEERRLADELNEAFGKEVADPASRTPSPLPPFGLIYRLRWELRVRRSGGERRRRLERARDLAIRRVRLSRSIGALDVLKGALENWRTVHIPVAAAFYLLVAVHVWSILYY